MQFNYLTKSTVYTTKPFKIGLIFQKEKKIKNIYIIKNLIIELYC